MAIKIDEMAIKYTNIVLCKTLKKYPNWDDKRFCDSCLNTKYRNAMYFFFYILG
jgi:hypothetical protein